VRELRAMHECNSDYVPSFYGAFENEKNDIVLCTEYMNVGVSLVLKRILDIYPYANLNHAIL
jgi:mitogen-activated protein kinase kinase